MKVLETYNTTQKIVQHQTLRLEREAYAAAASSPLRRASSAVSYCSAGVTASTSRGSHYQHDVSRAGPSQQHTLTVAGLPRSHSVRLSTRNNNRHVGDRQSQQNTVHENATSAVMAGSSDVVDEEVGTLRFVTDDTEKMPSPPPQLAHSKLARELCLTCLVAAVILFLCQLVAAGCLCRPVVVLAGLWVAALMLCKGILGLRVVVAPTHGMLVGDVVLSVLAGLGGVMAAAYLVSGHITVSCVSDFHRLDHSTAIRLYILEFTGILASIPCIAGAVSSFIAAAISAQAARTPKVKPETPVVLFLRSWGDDPVCTTASSSNSAPETTPTHLEQQRGSNPQVSDSQQRGTGEQRATTPPPNYNQVAQESFA